MVATGFGTLYSHDPNSEILDSLEKMDHFLTKLKEDDSIENFKWAILAVHMVVQSIALKANTVEDQTAVLRKNGKLAGIETELDFSQHERFVVTPQKILIGRAFYLEDIEPLIEAIQQLGKTVTKDVIIDRINDLYHLHSLPRMLTKLQNRYDLQNPGNSSSDFGQLSTKTEKLTQLRDGFVHFHPWKQIYDAKSLVESIQGGIKIVLLALEAEPNLYGDISQFVFESVQSQVAKVENLHLTLFST